MSDGNDTWDKVGKYFDSMTELAADSVKEFAGEFGELWNQSDDGSLADSVVDAMRESVGVGVRNTAKAWVETRQLMLDLAE
jgi:hypothetical protein